jgi:hypothetical protein
LRLPKERKVLLDGLEGITEVIKVLQVYNIHILMVHLLSNTLHLSYLFIEVMIVLIADILILIFAFLLTNFHEINTFIIVLEYF